MKNLFNFFTKASDPVCGMRLEKNSPDLTFSHQGKNYYFCSPSCRQQFESKPEKYVRQETKAESGGCCCNLQALK